MAVLSGGSRATQLVRLTAAVLLVTLPAAQGLLPEFVEHPRAIVARPGANVSFGCHAKPVGAVLSWISDGIVLINGSEAAFGKVVIDVATDGQAGFSVLRVQDVADGVNVSFRCLASIPGQPGVVASKAAMLVKARLRPFRKVEDSVVSAAVGNTVSIRCSAMPQSIPPAAFVFERNGTTIDESNGRYHLLPNGELQIARAHSGDSGPYRCVAVNEITMQKVEASNVIKLQVYDPIAGEPPAPVRYAPRLAVLEGGQILLPCLATGSPPPVIKWEKYDSLSGGRDSLSGVSSVPWLGNLRVLKAKETDAGTYVCRAENEHAKANPVAMFTELEVVLLPRITRTPTDQVAEEGASAAFRCTLRRGVEQTAAIVWMHDGYPVGGGGSGILIENGTDGGNTSSMLTIGSVQIRHQGVYQCLASNGAGEETAHALLRVHEAPAWRKQSPWPTDERRAGSGSGSNGHNTVDDSTTTMTLPPPSVKQSSSSPEVIVRWSATSNLKKASRSFRVEMKNQSLADWLAVFTELPTHTVQVTVGRLKPGTVYRFRIVADLLDGRVIHGAAARGYRLQLSKPSGTTATPVVQPLTSFTAGDQGIGVNEWRSSVTSLLKQSRASATPTKPPSEAGIIMPPPKPTIKQIGETSVLVQWTQSFQGMPITFYRIQYKDTDSGGRRGQGAQWVTADHDVKPPATQYELSGLRPGGSYKFRLAAVYVNRDNRVSEATDRVHLAGSGGIRSSSGSGRRLPPQLVPRLTHLLSQAAGQMFLSWEYLTDPAPIDGFVVQYMPVESHPRLWHESRVAGFNSRNWELRGLLPNTSYQVCVRSENAAGRSPCSNTLMRTTKAESTASSFDDVLAIMNQPNRGPAPAQTPHAPQGTSGLGDGGRPSDEDYQPATRGRTSQQPDELLYMVVGVVAGAMLLTLVVFIVACVRRQLVQKRCLTNLPPPTAGEKDDTSTGIRTSQRTFTDASRLIFNDVLQQKDKPPPERRFSPVPGLLSLSSDVAQYNGQTELLDSPAKQTNCSVNSKCDLLPEVPVKYQCLLNESSKDRSQSKEEGFASDDGRGLGASASSSLSKRLSAYGCAEGDTDAPSARPLTTAGGCSPSRSAAYSSDGEEEDDDNDDGVDCSSLPRSPQSGLPELAAEAESSSSDGCERSEQATMQRRRSLDSLPATTCLRAPSPTDPPRQQQQPSGGRVDGLRVDGRPCKQVVTGYGGDRPISKQDSAESRPFG